jgi:hypothetical protein
MTLTVPPQGMLTVSFPLRREDKLTLRASWTFEAPLSWEQYGAWVRPRLDAFQERPGDPMTLWFSRIAEGDAVSLRLARQSHGGLLVVAVTFEARPY